jgi:hypothetical protein
MKPTDFLKYEFGSLKNLAEKLELTPNAVVLWGQTHIPLKYVKLIEELSSNRLTKEQLRPDLFKKD